MLLSEPIYPEFNEGQADTLGLCPGYNFSEVRKSKNFQGGDLSKRRRRLTVAGQSLADQFDWSIDPHTLGEVIGVLLMLIGVLLTLSTLGLAGRFGQILFDGLSGVFGFASFLIPFVLIISGVSVFRQTTAVVRPITVVGLVIGLIFTPGLFGLVGSGGYLGDVVARSLGSMIGPIATFFVLIGLTIIATLLATNRQLKAWRFWSKAQLAEKLSPVKVNTGGVPIFNMDRSRSKTPGQITNHPTAVSTQRLVPSGQSWQFPALDLLELSAGRAVPGNINKNVEIINKTLADFNIDVSMGDVNVGPTVTQYTFKPAEGVKLTAITARASDLALTLAAHPIRVEAPIPGKSAVGIEVPNKQAAIVTLREVLQVEDYQHAQSNLALALGRDVAGEPVVVDLAKMPHLMIAGATGSGKSVCVNGIILSLIFANSPATLRLILVDPKRVEFTMYDGIPHLLAPVVQDVDKTVNALRWAIAEMERRFQLFSDNHFRNLAEYNVRPHPGEGLLPYIIVIIDELADLMAQAAQEVEGAIVRLSQMARATGIHLVVATQRPSVDVITGLIKANIPTRIAFAVASQIDSRTIIDQAGAEKLLGNGDMLYLGSEFGRPKRVQGVYVKEKEIKAVTSFLKEQSGPLYNEGILAYHPKGLATANEMVIDDELFEEAKHIVVSAGKASASLLQRRLRIGYARAARLIDMLEQEAIIGPADGAKPREVLASTPLAATETQSWDQ